MPNPLDKLFGRDTTKEDGQDDDGLKDLLADARRRRGVPPNGYVNRGGFGGSGNADNDNNNSISDLDDISSFFANHPFFGGGRFGGSIGPGESSSSTMLENMMMGAATHSSSYQIHQDGKEVTIDVDLPGVSAKELKVEVLQNIQSCVVQWSGQRKQQRQQQRPKADRYGRHQSPSSSSSSSNTSTIPSFDNRLRLGPQVDCDNLTANLSHGILTMKAPMKDVQEGATVRSIEVTENQD